MNMYANHSAGQMHPPVNVNFDNNHDNPVSSTTCKMQTHVGYNRNSNVIIQRDSQSQILKTINNDNASKPETG